MIITREAIKLAKQHLLDYSIYVKHMERFSPMIKPKTFRDKYGYEILLYENGGFNLKQKKQTS